MKGILDAPLQKLIAVRCARDRRSMGCASVCVCASRNEPLHKWLRSELCISARLGLEANYADSDDVRMPNEAP